MSEFKSPRLERGESIVGSVIHDEARGVQVAKVLTPSAIDLNERVEVVKRFDREGAELPEGEPVAKAWSDEARAAAAEARRNSAHGKNLKAGQTVTIRRTIMGVPLTGKVKVSENPDYKAPNHPLKPGENYRMPRALADHERYPYVGEHLDDGFNGPGERKGGKSYLHPNDVVPDKGK